MSSAPSSSPTVADNTTFAPTASPSPGSDEGDEEVWIGVALAVFVAIYVACCFFVHCFAERDKAVDQVALPEFDADADEDEVGNLDPISVEMAAV